MQTTFSRRVLLFAVVLCALAAAEVSSQTLRPIDSRKNVSLSPSELRTANRNPQAGSTPVQPTPIGDDAELPRTAGQVWKTYDLRPYTSKLAKDHKPQQAIVDWILRETGTEVWFEEPLGLLSASRSTLSVYHTPEMQRIVSDVVNRFTNNPHDSQRFSLRLITLNSPNWRSRAYRLMQPVPVQSAGIEAWLLSKENAAVLLAELKRRMDYQEHNSPNVLIANGQSELITKMRPLTYTGGIRLRPGGGDLETRQMQEGFVLQFNPLVARDGQTVDAVIRAHIDQVERFVPVTIEVPGPGGVVQRVQIQVPQMVSWRLLERFRWPTEQVLLLSCGVVANPGPERRAALSFPNPFGVEAGRADALLMIQVLGPEQAAVTPPGQANLPGMRKRY